GARRQADARRAHPTPAGAGRGRRGVRRGESARPVPWRATAGARLRRTRPPDTMLRQVVVKEAMSPDLYVATPNMPVTEAARVMIERKIGCLPVVENGKLVGIVTETDFVRLIADHQLRES